jgi:hypothetical protein
MAASNRMERQAQTMLQRAPGVYCRGRNSRGRRLRLQALRLAWQARPAA